MAQISCNPVLYVKQINMNAFQKGRIIRQTHRRSKNAAHVKRPHASPRPSAHVRGARSFSPLPRFKCRSDAGRHELLLDARILVRRGRGRVCSVRPAASSVGRLPGDSPSSVRLLRDATLSALDSGQRRRVRANRHAASAVTSARR
jgi:hypothetical protein